MRWELHIAGSAQKSLKGIPADYRRLIIQALDNLEIFPFRGDIQKIGPASWRRRIASYRIFFDIYYEERVIVVTAITRRQSKTY